MNPCLNKLATHKGITRSQSKFSNIFGIVRQNVQFYENAMFRAEKKPFSMKTDPEKTD
jgi:hypothetical protein